MHGLSAFSHTMEIIPPELRVVTRLLASTEAQNLVYLLPSLVGHVLRSEHILSTAHDPKSKSSSEAYALVCKLKTQITTLLANKNSIVRFSGIALAKAIIDVGGKECLHTSGLWAHLLISILQVGVVRSSPFILLIYISNNSYRRQTH